MKKILIILIGCLVLVGCDNKQPIDNTEIIQASPSPSDSTIHAVADSMVTLKVEMDSLKNQVYSLRNKVETQEASIGDLKVSKANKFFWYLIGVPALLVFILIIAIYKFAIRSSEIGTRIQKFDALKQKVDNLESKLNQVISQTNNAFRQVTSHQQTIGRNVSIDSLEKRIENLERVVEHLTKEEVALPVKQTSTQVDVYFGNLMSRPDGFAFFYEKYDSCTDEANFKVQINGDFGTFELVDINRINSSNINDKAIRTVGSVTIKEAKDFQTIKKGKVHFEKRESNDIWVLVEPCEIKLIK